jgi:hypothetical protein
VARAYINSHPEKVARVLTIATPYWGAAMPWLALAHGLTGPPTDSWWPDLDSFIPNDELQLFAVNAAGAYNLYPSPAYYEQIGGWLSFSGGSPSGGITYLTQDQTLSAVRQFLGNKSLYKQALEYHTSYLDTYYRNPNVPWHMIVGTGVKTLTGIVYREDSAKPTYIYGNGDGTVPILSAAEGVEDTAIVHYVCGIEHSKLPEQKGVQAMIKDYIYTGGPIVNPQGGFCEPPE